MRHLNIPHALSSLSPDIMLSFVPVDSEEHKQNALKTHQTDTLLLNSAAQDSKRQPLRSTQEELSISF